ncbi:hypothetical protein BGW42_001215 [Actinomortierella wolfii]|nr:hypothetical protein BGW42_001215 [Actinomortierella wolfii]
MSTPSHIVQTQQDVAQQQSTGSDTDVMHCLVDFAIYPDTKTPRSLSECICEIEKVLQKQGVSYKVQRHGTYFHGTMSDVLKAIEACHASMHAKCGCTRLCSNIRLETKMGKFKEEEMTQKEA